MLTNNSKYVSAEVIMADLARKYKSFEWDLDDVIEWCAQVETNYIPEVNQMVHYVKVPLTVTSRQVELPCNIHRILDVYDSDEARVQYYNNGAFLVDLRDDTGEELDDSVETIYINYVGLPLDDDGIPLILKGHEPACETFCKINFFEEKVALGEFSPDLWEKWNQQFSGQITSAKQSVRHMDRYDIDKLNIIKGNMIIKIGSMPIKQNTFEK